MFPLYEDGHGKVVEHCASNLHVGLEQAGLRVSCQLDTNGVVEYTLVAGQSGIEVHIPCGRFRKVAVMGGGITIAIYYKAIDDTGVCLDQAVVELLQFGLALPVITCFEALGVETGYQSVVLVEQVNTAFGQPAQYSRMNGAVLLLK